MSQVCLSISGLKRNALKSLSLPFIGLARENSMTDLRRAYATDRETERASGQIFRIVAGIIVVLVCGAIGAFYLGMMS